ncbi:hypothetical protein ACP70R_001845 [Stipagrostis hirtigluma subsp. patula]
MLVQALSFRLQPFPIEIPKSPTLARALQLCGGAGAPLFPLTSAVRRSAAAHHDDMAGGPVDAGAGQLGHKRAPLAAEDEDSGFAGIGRGRGAARGRQAPSALASTSHPATTNPSSGSKNSKKRNKTRDLKSFFSSNLSNGSVPSTHESGIIVSQEGEVQGEVAGETIGLGDAETEQQEEQVVLDLKMHKHLYHHKMQKVLRFLTQMHMLFLIRDSVYQLRHFILTLETMLSGLIC